MRQLPSDHPVFQLLEPHFEGTGFINEFANSDLIGPGGIVEQLTSQKSTEVNPFIGKQILEYLKNDLSFPALLKARKMNKFKAPYPYADDGILIWGCIFDWCDSYVKLFYKNDQQVMADERIQDWIQELVSGGKIEWLAKFNYSIQALSNLLATIIFTASAGHARFGID